MHRSSARPIATKKKDDSTWSDWITVFSYMDDHADMSQVPVAKHKKQDKALVFNQLSDSSLS